MRGRILGKIQTLILDGSLNWFIQWNVFFWNIEFEGDESKSILLWFIWTSSLFVKKISCALKKRMTLTHIHTHSQTSTIHKHAYMRNTQDTNTNTRTRKSYPQSQTHTTLESIFNESLIFGAIFFLYGSGSQPWCRQIIPNLNLELLVYEFGTCLYKTVVWL